MGEALAYLGSHLEPEPVGPQEVATLLGVKPATVHTWRTRGIMPPPRWTLSGVPIWEAREIQSWHQRRQPGSPKTGSVVGTPNGIKARDAKPDQSQGVQTGSVVGPPSLVTEADLEAIDAAILATSDTAIPAPVTWCSYCGRGGPCPHQ